MRSLALVPSLLLSSAALAEIPSVATDITPVHGLVSMVMGDLGTPALLVEPGASPHGYALRPSQAAALQNADAVFWIGHDLTPWLDDPLDSLARQAVVVELLDTEGTVVHQFREDAVFAHDEHDEHEDGHEGHAHDGADPHAWLDPENAVVWLAAIAETLSGLDPDNADTYRTNAAAAQAEITALNTEIATRLAPVSTRSFVVFHDAFQYFEQRFDLSSAGAISMSDASSPSAARIAEIRDAVAEQDVVCVFSEPQFNPGLVATVAAGTELTTAIIDPLGSDLPLGADFYPALIHSIAASVEGCLSAE
jgi:zinc transport system substrate-binding protein